MQLGTVKAVKCRARGAVVTMLFASLLALGLALILTVPVGAQQTNKQTGNEAQITTKKQYASSEKPEQTVQQSGQQRQKSDETVTAQTATRATKTLQGAEALIIESSDMVNRIEIVGAGCNVGKGATVVVEDGSGDSELFLDGIARGDEASATIQPLQSQVIINGIDNSSLKKEFGFANNDKNGEVVGSTGITCDQDDRDDESVASVEDLEDLECGELLRRFRNAGTRQYGIGAQFADVDVQNQLIVCLEQEVVQNTAADEDLPDTGGVSLLALAALGLVSAAAGVSVIRGARREE